MNKLQNILGDRKIGSSRPNRCNELSYSDLQFKPEKIGTKPGQMPSLQISLYDLVGQICKEKKMYFRKPLAYVEYKPPKLTRGKVWYISYYAINPQTGKLKRVRIKLDHINPVRERIKAAHAIVADITERLALGWNPFEKAATVKSTRPALEVFDIFIKAKEREMEKQSLHSYRSFINVFRSWIISQGADEHTTIGSISPEIARAFMTHVEDEMLVSPTTYNNYLSFLLTFFGWMKERRYIGTNPFEGIERKQRKPKRRRTFSTDELQRLFSFLGRDNPEFLAVCLLCYCCFIRPKEIALLKCSDISLEMQSVHIRGEIAKNDNESYRTIPDVIIPVLRHLDLSHPDWYVFGHHAGDTWCLKSSPIYSNQKKYSDYWNIVRKELNFGKDLQFYSLKDTGITNMLGASVPISFVQQQADHSSVAMTAVYVGKSPSANATLKKVDIISKK